MKEGRRGGRKIKDEGGKKGRRNIKDEGGLQEAMNFYRSLAPHSQQNSEWLVSWSQLCHGIKVEII
jgi:hypothetical protein